MMKLGAADYLVKGLDLIDIILVAIGRLFEQLYMLRQLRAAEKAARRSESNKAVGTDLFAFSWARRSHIGPALHQAVIGQGLLGPFFRS